MNNKIGDITLPDLLKIKEIYYNDHKILNYINDYTLKNKKLI